MKEKPTYIATDGTVFDTAEACIEHTKEKNKEILADTRLYDMLDKDIESISDYIKTARQFWMYNEQEKAHVLIEITHVRANVAFYKQVGSIEEKAFFKNSAGACFLYPRHIFVDDVVKHVSKRIKFENHGEAYQYVYTFFRTYSLDVPEGCEIDIIA